MRAIKIMLLGFAFLLLGIWGTIISVNNGDRIFIIISLVCPVIGFIVVIAGLRLNK